MPHQKIGKFLILYGNNINSNDDNNNNNFNGLNFYL